MYHGPLTRLKQIKNRFTFLIASLLVLMVIYPYVEGSKTLGEPLLRLFLSCILFASVYAISDNQRHFTIALCIAIPTFIMNAMFFFHVNEFLIPLSIVFFICFEVYTAFTIHLYIFKKHISGMSDVTIDTVLGAISVYLLMGLAWAGAYNLLETMQPGSFYIDAAYDVDLQMTWSDFLYYSFTTLTTLGYGDIVPITSQGRSLAMLEAVTGVLFVAVLVARLVGMYRFHQKPQSNP